MRRKLLLCGIISSVLYAAMVILVPLQWAGYSSASQTISELSAIDAPTRLLWAFPGAVYTLLMIVFASTVVQMAGENRRVRLLGRLLLAYSLLGLLWPLAPMHTRDVLAAAGATLSDTMHIALGVASVVLMLFALGAGMRLFSRWFRDFSLATLFVLVVFGVLTFLDAPDLSANRPTPWLGVWERINVGAFMLWVAVLSLRLFRELVLTRASTTTAPDASTMTGLKSSS